MFVKQFNFNNLKNLPMKTQLLNNQRITPPPFSFKFESSKNFSLN